MNGDLRLFRRRWWGSWAIGATVLLALCFLVPMLFEPNDGLPRMHARGAAILIAVMIAGLFCCYAPWTFFWLLRLFALVVVALTVWYVVDEVRLGRWVTEPGKEQSAVNAVRCFLAFGLPCLWIALMKRPRACPYDEQGRSRPFEIDRTFRVLPLKSTAPDADAGRTEPQRAVKFDYGGLSRIEVLDPNPPGVFRVTLPLDPTGVAVWNDWQRRLAEVGHGCEVVEDQPGRRSFVNAVLHSVKDRWTRGRRVPVTAKNQAE